MNKLAEYISNNHKGHKNACPSSTLENVFQVNERLLRDMIVEAIEKDNVLICSCNEGYYIPITSEDFSIGYNHLVAPFEQTRKRAEKIKFLWQVQNVKQGQFQLGV